MIANKKALERLYAKTAAKLLGRNWDFGPDREVPDFVVQECGSRFGLEVTEIFTGPVDDRGAVMKREESAHQKRIRQLQQEYEAEEALPLVVQLVGDIREANLKSVIAEIRLLELAEKKPGYQTRIEIDEGDGILSVYVTKALRPDWLYVDDRVGWVNLKPQQVIEQAIAEKASKVEAYRKGADSDDVRLLIVANRIQNSGKLKLNGDVAFDLAGFNTLYFLSYPEEVQEFGAN